MIVLDSCVVKYKQNKGFLSSVGYRVGDASFSIRDAYCTLHLSQEQLQAHLQCPDPQLSLPACIVSLGHCVLLLASGSTSCVNQIKLQSESAFKVMLLK